MSPIRRKLELEAQSESKEEILRKVRKTDFWYRFFLALMVLIVLLGVGISILGQYRILQGLQKSSDMRTEQLQELQKHIDCIVDLFAKPNHNQFTIQDVNGCKIKQNPSASSISSNSQIPTSSYSSLFQPSSGYTLQNPSSPQQNSSTAPIQGSKGGNQGNQNGNGGQSGGSGQQSFFQQVLCPVQSSVSPLQSLNVIQCR